MDGLNSTQQHAITESVPPTHIEQQSSVCVDRVVLLFSDKSEIVTAREVLCDFGDSWLKRAFCGRYEGLVTQDKASGSYFVVGASGQSNPRIVRKAVEFVVSGSSATAQTDTIVTEVEAWYLLNEAIFFGLKQLARAVVIRICELNVAIQKTDSNNTQLKLADFVRFLENENVVDAFVDAIEQLNDLNELCIYCGMMRIAVAAKCFRLTTVIKVSLVLFLFEILVLKKLSASRVLCDYPRIQRSTTYHITCGIIGFVLIIFSLLLNILVL